MREAADDDNIPDIEDLWYIEARTNVADWLTEHGWNVTSFEAAELMTRYSRCSPLKVDDTTPRTVFVEGNLTG